MQKIRGTNGNQTIFFFDSFDFQWKYWFATISSGFSAKVSISLVYIGVFCEIVDFPRSHRFIWETLISIIFIDVLRKHHISHFQWPFPRKTSIFPIFIDFIREHIDIPALFAKINEKHMMKQTDWIHNFYREKSVI